MEPAPDKAFGDLLLAQSIRSGIVFAWRAGKGVLCPEGVWRVAVQDVDGGMCLNRGWSVW